MSQLDGQTSTIDGHTYKVLYLDPLTASDLLQDIIKILAPAIGAVGGKMLSAEDTKKALGSLLDGKQPDQGSDFEASLDKAIVGLIDRVSKDKFREMVEQLAKVTSVRQGEAWPELSSILTVHFRGRLKSLYKWFGFALKVQFADFFSSIGPAIARVARLADQDPSQSQTI